FVGNVMIDALQASRHHWERSSIFRTLGLEPSTPYVVLTLHRPSNVDDARRLAAFLDAIDALARHIPVVFPVHPRVKQQLSHQGDGGITYVDPLGYLDFVALVSRARLVLTDSGGIQEETTILGIPCLTLRDTTERPVTVSHGTNRIIGSDPSRILDESLR